MVTHQEQESSSVVGQNDLKDLKKRIEKLEKENEGLVKDKQKLIEDKQSDEAFRKRATWWVAKIVSGLAILYLIWVAVAPNNVKPKDITNQEVAIAFVVLLFNSGLLDKLTGFSVSSGGIEAKFRELAQEVNQNKQKIDKNEDKIRDLQQQRLDEIEELTNLIYKAVLDGYEYMTLANLALDGKGRTDLADYEYNQLGESQLKRLYSINFIDLKSDKTFWEVKGQKISYRELWDHFYVTEDGQKYLNTIRRLRIQLRVAL